MLSEKLATRLLAIFDDSESISIFSASLVHPKTDKRSISDSRLTQQES